MTAHLPSSESVEVTKGISVPRLALANRGDKPVMGVDRAELWEPSRTACQHTEGHPYGVDEISTLLDTGIPSFNSEE